MLSSGRSSHLLSARPPWQRCHAALELAAGGLLGCRTSAALSRWRLATLSLTATLLLPRATAPPTATNAAANTAAVAKAAAAASPALLIRRCVRASRLAALLHGWRQWRVASALLQQDSSWRAHTAIHSEMHDKRLSKESERWRARVSKQVRLVAIEG